MGKCKKVDHYGGVCEMRKGVGREELKAGEGVISLECVR